MRPEVFITEALELARSSDDYVFDHAWGQFATNTTSEIVFNDDKAEWRAKVKTDLRFMKAMFQGAVKLHEPVVRQIKHMVLNWTHHHMEHGDGKDLAKIWLDEMTQNSEGCKPDPMMLTSMQTARLRLIASQGGGRLVSQLGAAGSLPGGDSFDVPSKGTKKKHKKQKKPGKAGPVVDLSKTKPDGGRPSNLKKKQAKANPDTKGKAPASASE